MAVYIMARCLLFPNYVVALMAPDGKQSKMLFQKIEDIATHKLESIKNRSNVFYNEVVKGPNSNGLNCKIYKIAPLYSDVYGKICLTAGNSLEFNILQHKTKV